MSSALQGELMATRMLIGRVLALLAVLLTTSAVWAEETHVRYFQKLENPAAVGNAGNASTPAPNALPLLNTFTTLHTMLGGSQGTSGVVAGVFGAALVGSGAIAGARTLWVTLRTMIRHQRLTARERVFSLSPAPIFTKNMVGLALVGKF